MKEIRYQEVQRLTDSWLGKIVGAILLYLGGVCVDQLFLWQITWSGLLPVLLMIFGLVLFFGSRLYTRIDSSGVTYQFSPFHTNPRYIAWEDIQGSVVRRYSPLREYGGWGIRFGRNGLALSTSGHYGLQIVLKNGRQILIGTQKKDRVDEILRELHEVRK